VIFLGAGASKGSGFPLANDLRLLISSRDKWEEALVQYENKHGLANRPITSLGLQYWQNQTRALDLFRNGGFATLDEFCKLAGQFRFQDEINSLRGLVRAALGLFNPEEHFEKSEYYGFIQSLFDANLVDLRSDITVLTYNYDIYLEFLLFRALEHRRKVMRKGASIALSEGDLKEHSDFENILNCVTSGFYSHKNLHWLGEENSKPQFRILQLHGSIGIADNIPSDFQTFFSTNALDRAQVLFQDPPSSVPPIMFPWEIISEKGLIPRESSTLGNHPSLYSLFSRIWSQARIEVEAAKKVSFVGLSMHQFMFDGLRFLFQDKTGELEVCVANPENVTGVQGKSATHWAKQPHSHAYNIHETLKKVAPNISRKGYVEGYGYSDGDFTLVKDLAGFVKTQMKPI
jgi:hypothetical protein